MADRIQIPLDLSDVEVLETWPRPQYLGMPKGDRGDQKSYMELERQKYQKLLFRYLGKHNTIDSFSLEG